MESQSVTNEQNHLRIWTKSPHLNPCQNSPLDGAQSPMNEVASLSKSHYRPHEIFQGNAISEHQSGRGRDYPFNEFLTYSS